MAKKKKNTLPNDAQEAAQKLFFAGVGALSMAEEEGSKLFKQLVKKGKKYDGEARQEVAELRKQIEGRAGQAKKQALQVRDEVDQRTNKVRSSLDTQVDRVRKAADTQIDQVRKVADDTLSDIERRVQDVVTATLQGLGIPTRDEIASLRDSVQKLSKNLDALKHERAIEAESQPEVMAVETGNGWYNIIVYGRVVGKVHGEEEAVEEVSRLQKENAVLTDAERSSGVQAEKGGGGWYTIKLNGLTVDKVQGKEAADTEVARLEAQA
jgi:poly(hydroxyalkanoate) granule-associated protein